MNIRENIEKREHEVLSPYAQKANESRGRDFPISEDEIRTCYMRDRDRIVHSHVFRREKDKSQVFLFPNNAHIMNRLTHSLEVTQIAKGIASALNLNEDLAETIALGHDTAHTCFGHAGEEGLNEIFEYGYNHAKAAERRLNVISNLNLTKEVIDGIVNHSGLSNNPHALTLEGKICPFADKIAYLTSDMENAITEGLISDIPERFKKTLGTSKSKIIKTLIRAIIEESYEKNQIKMEDSIYQEFKELRDFCFQEIYFHPILKEQKFRCKMIVQYLYKYFLQNPSKLPKSKIDCSLEQQIVDYISGMTDSFAMNLFTNFNI